MKDWFEWNGVRCTDYGIHVLEQPPLTMPKERATFTSIPGRSGTLTVLEGDDIYDDMILTATCVIDCEARIPNLTNWLRGGGTVCFANRPGGYYNARIVNQISFEKILRGNPHRKFAVNFRCQPFWYEKNPHSIVLTNSGSSVNNPGTVFSEPVITVYGSGNISLTVGTTAITLSDVAQSITVDSVQMECYKGTTNCNSKMSGDFPTLKPGNQVIRWTGNVTQVEIQPNWRYL